MMFRRKRPEPPPEQRANPIAIAVLEHDLLGIKPEPGTMAALSIALRRTGTCLTHSPVETTALDDPGPVAICQGCSRHMIRNERGEWTIA